MFLFTTATDLMKEVLGTALTNNFSFAVMHVEPHVPAGFHGGLKTPLLRNGRYLPEVREFTETKWNRFTPENRCGIPSVIQTIEELKGPLDNRSIGNLSSLLIQSNIYVKLRDTELHIFQDPCRLGKRSRSIQLPMFNFKSFCYGSY